jgi:two-component sensor histidine kinase
MIGARQQDEELASLRTALAEKEQALAEGARLVEGLLLHVKDNSRMILNLLALQTDRVTDAEARREVGELAARALAIVHERLDRREAATVDLAAYLRELGDHLSCFYAHLGIDLALAVEADAATVATGDAVTLGLIVNELVADSADHVFPDGRGEVRIELRRGEAGGMRLTVGDNSRWRAEERRGGPGLRLVELLAAHLGAEVAIDASPRQGTEVTVAFPLRERQPA